METYTTTLITLSFVCSLPFFDNFSYSTSVLKNKTQIQNFKILLKLNTFKLVKLKKISNIQIMFRNDFFVIVMFFSNY